MAHRLAAEAETELDEIWWYIAMQSGNPAAAQKVIGSITERFYLPASPGWAARVTTSSRACAAIRPTKYIIFYAIEGEDVVILHVIDGRRDIPNILD